MFYPVILCGGFGSRLWPISRKSYPKQFVKFEDGHSLFQATCQRVRTGPFNNPVIVSSEQYRFASMQQLSEIGVEPQAIILEPDAKNTTSAILIACHYLYRKDKQAILVILPSDHLITDTNAFEKMVKSTKKLASDGDIVTFGVLPNRAETGFGYIERDACGHVIAFHEKPAKSRAQMMVKDGNFLWNSGIFIAKAEILINEAYKFSEKTASLTFQSLQKSETDMVFIRPDNLFWSQIEGKSIDVEIMEKTDRLKCVPFEGRWSDLGDWSTLTEELLTNDKPNDKTGNFIRGRVIENNTSNCILWNNSEDAILAVAGQSNKVIITTADATLVSNKDNAEGLKALVNSMSKEGIIEAHQNIRSYRPWGWYERLVSSKGYQVKRICVNSRQRLSLQSHKYRSEHWVVTSGKAVVQIEQKIFDLTVNESTYIAAGQKHRLSNNQNEPLILIEVQTGSYLGEDDIQRFEDDYYRS